MIRPPYLKTGSRIGIVSTARKIFPNELVRCREVLEQNGYVYVESPYLYKIHNQMAGDDEIRRKALQQMLDDPTIDAIMCSRGGYGTSRIIDKITWDKFKEHPKWIIGFSDITVLHSALLLQGVEAVHGSVGMTFTSVYNQENIKQLLRFLSGKPLNYQMPHSDKHNRPGAGKGQVVGGNLSLLVHQVGTPTDIDTDGKILFIEDLDEHLYHIDRMFLQLYRAGKLKNLAGLIIGTFVQVKDNAVAFGYTVEEIVQRLVKEYDYPVVYNFPAGHGFDNLPLVFGREATLNVTAEKYSLTFSGE